VIDRDAHSYRRQRPRASGSHPDAYLHLKTKEKGTVRLALELGKEVEGKMGDWDVV